MALPSDPEARKEEAKGMAESIMRLADSNRNAEVSFTEVTRSPNKPKLFHHWMHAMFMIYTPVVFCDLVVLS